MKIKNTDNIRKFVPALVFGCVFCFLLYCAAPGLYWGDSAEMAAVSCDLGVAHSPGYPLYTQLSRVFSWLPISEYPFRLNVMSAVLTALSALLLFGAAAGFCGGSPWAGLAAVAGLLGCREFVRYGLIAEVYPLHLLFFSALLFFSSKKIRAGGGVVAQALFVISLFSISHHLMALIALGAFVIFMALQSGHRWRIAVGPPALLLGAGVVALFRSHDTAPAATLSVAIALAFLAVSYLVYIGVLAYKKKIAPGTIAFMFTVMFLFVAATILYAHIPIASARGPVSNWWAPQTTQNFFRLLLLQGYESTFPTNGIEWMKRLNIVGLLLQVPVFIIVVAIPGIIFMFRKNWRAALFLIMLLAVSFLGSMIVEHGKPEALRLPVYITLYMFSAVGAWAFVTWRIFSGGGFRIALKVLAVLLVLVVFALNLPDSDWRFMRSSASAGELARRILDEVRPGSVLFIGTQTPSIMNYYQACEPEKMRLKNINIIPVSFLSFDWAFDQIRALAPGLRFPPRPEEMRDKQVFTLSDQVHVRYAAEILAQNGIRDGAYADYKIFDDPSGWKTIPRGVVYQLVPGDTEPDRLKKMAAADKTPEWNPATARDMTSAANIGSIFNERGKIYLEKAFADNDDLGVVSAINEFDAALAITDAAVESLNSALIVEKTAIEKIKDTFNIGQGGSGDSGIPKEFEAGLQSLQQAQEKKQDDETGALGIFYSLVGPLLDVKAEATSNKGSALIYQGDYKEGLSLMHAAVRLSPMNPSLYEALATVYFRQQNPEAVLMAIALWKASLLFDSKNPRVMHNIASALVGLKQKEQAVEYYKAAITMDSKYRSAYINLARLYNKLENCQMAIITLENAKTVFPLDLELRSELAQQYADCKMKHLYAKEVQSMMEDFPNDALLFYTLAIVFRNGMQVGNMVKAIKEVKTREPDFPVRKFFESMMDCESAIWLLGELVKELPDEADIELELSLRYGMCGDEARAIEVMKGIVKKYPNNEGAKMLLDSFIHPEKYYGEEATEEAGSTLEDYIRGGR